MTSLIPTEPFTSFVTTGQVLEVDLEKKTMLIYLDNLLDEDDRAWIPVLSSLPDWTLDGTVFTAEISRSIKTFGDLVENPEGIQNFRPSPRPHLTTEELARELLERMDKNTEEWNRKQSGLTGD